MIGSSTDVLINVGRVTAEDIKHYAYGALVDYAVSPYYEGFVINSGHSSC